VTRPTGYYESKPKPASNYWWQGYGVSNDNVVRFVQEATRDRVMAQALAAGYRVVKRDDEAGFGFMEAG
jgi:hypothetical protein